MFHQEEAHNGDRSQLKVGVMSNTGISKIKLDFKSYYDLKFQGP